jgi:4-amino-4-deoxy-L-arabinose transferase-like glycosyltransferase
MQQKYLIAVIVFALFVRLILLDYPALIDPTEGRYAYIAQEMVISGDWVTPKIPYSGTTIPYLGKPPLHFWATALSFELFGMHAWSARLPSFLALLIICFCIWTIGKYYLDRGKSLGAMIILISSGMGFITSGSVIVDLTLTAGISLAVTGYLVWKKTLLERWGILIFLGLTCGFLIKGPVAVALFVIPVLVAEYPFNRERLNAPNGIFKWPWLKGVLLGLAITVPWFVISEIQNPGFIKYFFLNENVLRFLVTDYGDKYGTGHQYPYASAWGMFAFGFLPWTPLLLILAYFNRRNLRTSLKYFYQNEQFEARFLSAWMLTPLFVFTFSKQLHLGYVVPALPGAALLLSTYWDQLSFSSINISYRYFGLVICAIGLLFFFLGLVGWTSATLVYLSFFPAVGLIYACYKSVRNYECDVSFIAIFGLATVCVAGLSVTTFAGIISERTSTLPILECRSRDRLDAHPAVTVFGGSNFSALFYSRSDELVRPVLVTVMDNMMEDLRKTDDIILRKSKMKWTPKIVLERFRTVSKIGRWVWLHRKTVPLEIDDCKENRPFVFELLGID